MRPDQPAPEADPQPTALDAEAIAHLRALGQATHAAPSGQHRDAAIELVVRTAVRYQADGAAWPSIALALGVSVELLRQWRRCEDTKPVRFQPPHPTPTDPTLNSRDDRPPATTTSMSISQSQSATISQHSNQSQFAKAELTGGMAGQFGLVRLGHARCVLAVSGDARPGGNDFSLEVAEIRQRLSPAQVDVRELGAAELGEISYRLDYHQPAVLHVCAHSAFGGMYLPLEGTPSTVAHSAVWKTITAARRPPRLVVLNVCHWPTVHGPGAADVESLICWPALVDDQHAKSFSRLLYSALAMRRTVGAAFHDAHRMVCDRWPDLEPPALHGNYDYPIF